MCISSFVGRTDKGYGRKELFLVTCLPSPSTLNILLPRHSFFLCWNQHHGHLFELKAISFPELIQAFSTTPVQFNLSVLLLKKTVYYTSSDMHKKWHSEKSFGRHTLGSTRNKWDNIKPKCK